MAACVIGLILMQSLTAAIPQWRDDGAVSRILTFIPADNSHSFCVELKPLQLANIKSAAVYHHGALIPHREMMLDGSLYAIEISGFKAAKKARRTLDQAIEIYLYTDVRKQNPPDSAPVRLYQIPDKVVARPPTAEDFIEYLKRRPLKKTIKYEQLKDFNFVRNPDFDKQPPSKSKSKTKKPKPKPKPLVRFESSVGIFVSKAAGIRWRIVNENSCPWYLIVNNKGIFSWNDGQESEEIKLSAGLNRLQFYTLQQSYEQLPQLEYALNGGEWKKPESSILFSPDYAESIILERKKGQISGFSAQVKNRYHLNDRFFIADLHINDEHALYSDTAAKAELKVAQTSYSDKAVNCTVNSGEPVNVVLSSPDSAALHSRLLIDQRKAEDASLNFRLKAMPHFPVAGEALDVEYDLSYSANIAELAFRDARLVSRYYGKERKLLLSEAQSLPRSQLKRKLKLKLPEGLKHIELELQFFKSAVTETIRIYYVSPEMPARFKPAGNMLGYDDGYAVLRLSGKAVKAVPFNHSADYAVMDDFIASDRHTVKNLAPAQYSWTKAPDQYIRLMKDKALKGIFMKYLALNRIENRKNYNLVLAIGRKELDADLDLRSFRNEMQFLLQFCKQRKYGIIITTVPRFKKFDLEKQRYFALFMKEQASREGFNTIDLYSQSLFNKRIEEYWSIPYNQTVESSSADAAGRAFFWNQVNNLFKK